MPNDAGRRTPRIVAAARALNREPRLIDVARRTREWALGSEAVGERLSTARARPSDLAVRHVVRAADLGGCHVRFVGDGRQLGDVLRCRVELLLGDVVGVEVFGGGSG